MTIYVKFFGTVSFGIYYYSNDSKTKKMINNAFNNAYLFISLYCIIVLLICIGKKKKEVESGLTEDIYYSLYFNRILIILVINTLHMIMLI